MLCGRYSHLSGNRLGRLRIHTATSDAKVSKEVNRIVDSPRSRWMPGTKELRKNMEMTNPSTIKHLTSRLLSVILCCEREKHSSFSRTVFRFSKHSTVLHPLNCSKYFLLKIERQNLVRTKKNFHYSKRVYAVTRWDISRHFVETIRFRHMLLKTHAFPKVPVCPVSEFWCPSCK